MNNLEIVQEAAIGGAQHVSDCHTGNWFDVGPARVWFPMVAANANWYSVQWAGTTEFVDFENMADCLDYVANELRNWPS